MDSRLNIGHYVSGGAHALLIGYALFGGVFSSEPEPPVVTGVDIISTEQFERLLNSELPPQTADEVETPVAPELSEAPPAVIAEPDPVTPPRPPEPTEAPEPESAPEVEQPTSPPVDLTDTVPEITPPAEPEIAPEQSPRPVARPVTRVAPEAVATPEPDVQISDVDQAPTAPAESQTETIEAQEETAREEAAPEIPTEPKSGAVTSSIRPKARPSRPTPSQRPEPSSEPETNTADRESGVNDALAQALAETPATPSGPPLTQGEKDALRISVQECWVVDVGSQAANVTVTVAMSLDREGKVVGGSLRRLSASGGDENAAIAAFESARRAILRCQRGGYNLPIEKYDHWRDVEITFNPEKMRRR
ncbi:energy transducer TonB [Cognatishimia activa]|uniref:energy transducer TonB n=1 Tax=Cognatishimia activa TaxID=1715691 RepID=UPI00222EA78E|nr:energy transducer TonB [Cognatishimia activa]UZD89664.1 energy transducer TonB [Cognatishimia activa]